MLAQAGLERLGLNDHFTIVLHPPLMFPAVGQAALGIECRRDDEETASLLQQLSHAPTLAEVTAERACLHELRAGCHAPVGVVTEIGEDDQLRLQAVVLSGDGRELVEATVVGEQSSPAQLGRQAATELSRAGADKLLAVED